MMLGRLSPIYVYASNFWVAPCVAVARADRRFTRIQRKWPACWSSRWMTFSIPLAARRTSSSDAASVSRPATCNASEIACGERRG